LASVSCPVIRLEGDLFAGEQLERIEASLDAGLDAGLLTGVRGGRPHGKDL
jgi:hypothetical protein